MRLRSLPPVAQLVMGLGLIALCVALVVDTALVGVGLWAKHRSDEFVALPAALEVTGVPERTALLDSKGLPFAYFWAQNRSSVPADRMAPAVRSAAVAVEDARFYENKGVDLRATVRALVNNLSTGQHEGGSTITQQYVKNLLVVNARSKDGQQAATALNAQRKLAEARYAVSLAQRMTKDEILTGYLNIAYFGRDAYGVQAAAETFFATDAGALSVPQAALIAGLVKSPAAYDPFAHPEAALARRNLVLDRMEATGRLNAQEAGAARAAPLGVRDGAVHEGCPRSTAGYFCDWVLRQLLEDPALGTTKQQRQHRVDTAGLQVRTTLGPGTQASTQRAVDRAKGSRAAVAAVVQQPGTGAVLAMAASVPFGVGPGQSSVNLPLGGTTGYQAGSTFKVFVLTQAIKDGLPLNLRMYAPQTYSSTKFAPYNIVDGAATPYKVGNAADSESGVFTLEQATWHSVNTYYMKLEERVGFDGPAQIAESMGVRRADGSPLQRVPSFTLGTNEITPMAMAGAMATYAAHGKYCKAFGIREIGGLPRAETRPDCRQVLDRRIADTVTRVLAGVIEKGTGGNAAVPGGAAGKTGTVQDFSAAWFTGYTPRHAAAVWIGDPRGGYRHPLVNVRVGNRTYEHMYGGDVPAQVWAALVSGSPGGRAGTAFDLVAPAPSRAQSSSGSGAGGGGVVTAPAPAPAPKPTCKGHKCRR
ncbi:MAG TPA: transglycosylase domain-containing protein [Mycobacteriales bacterium]|nr:transglycosylase domain-containing protein [Mycobacteriales bacterium]